MTFASPVDICNRSAQHCGVSRIAAFTDDSLQASEFAFTYDKVRRAELRRNVWQFAIKQAAIRPILTGQAAGGNTMFLSPQVWSSTTTYAYGAIVADITGYLWQSLAQDNLNNAPGGSSAWDAYCGPQTVSAYDTTGTTGYFAGELVYETPGDGTYSVYLSLTSNNTQDPRDPTEWSAAASYSKDSVVLYYPAWASGTTYAAGNIISYADGNDYVSLLSSNTGNTPGASTLYWAVINSTLAPGYYNSTTAYVPGAFVTYNGTNYICILSSTGNVPASSPTYWIAEQAGTYYVSLIDFNVNQNPSSAPALWASGTTYAAGNTVGASDGYIYSSVGNGNVGNDPVGGGGVYWTNTGVLNPWTIVDPFGTANDQWLQLAVNLTDLTFVYPIGSGPTYQTTTKNAYMLPANFLRRAPQDSKAGSVSFLGAPTGLMYDDWELQGDFLVTREVFPILLRFVADLTNVIGFDDMFCEALAARVAIETVERLTQSTSKLAAITAQYNRVRTEAITVNGIETGPTEPPEDDYITCRI